MLINSGVQTQVLKVSTLEAGNSYKDFAIQSDAVLLTLYVKQITGTLQVSLVALNSDNSVLSPALLEFPEVLAPTTNLLIERTGVIPATLRVVATYTGSCIFEVNARAVSAGTSDTKILSASSWQVSQVTVNTTPVLLIPSAILDRRGFIIRNHSSSSQILYIAQDAVTATVGTGFPVPPGETFSVDVASGAEVYGVASEDNADIRYAQAGG